MGGCEGLGEVAPVEGAAECGVCCPGTHTNTCSHTALAGSRGPCKYRSVGWREWTGVGERRWKTGPDTEQVEPAKTLWNWLQLLIVPAILIGVTFAWSALQTRSDNDREDRRIEADRDAADQRVAADRAAAERVRQDTTLDGYFQQMSDLMLKNKLRSSKRADPVRSVAYTVTLTTLRRLDGERKGEVVIFLHNARLNKGGSPVFGLKGADLTGAKLEEADLVDVNLGGADLTRADLAGADLALAHLMEANLEGADLNGAILLLANLKGANLKGANLSYANLEAADLTDADLTNADLSNARLMNAKGLPPGNR